MRIGLISDTHGLIRPAALEALTGADMILHAGDVGDRHVLDALGCLAPVTVVRGNVDREAWADRLPETETLDVDGRLIHLLHVLDRLDLDPVAAGLAVVVYGHSHKPSVLRRDGVLYVNPGSAGPRRFDLPVAVAILTLGAGEPAAEIVELRV